MTQVSEKQLKEELRTDTKFAYRTSLPTWVEEKNNIYRSRYMTRDQDLMFHFFLPEGLVRSNKGNPTPDIQQFWEKVFPLFLATAAEKVFLVGHPRIILEYFHEVESWCLTARGFAMVHDVDGLCQMYLKTLLGEIQEAMSKK